MANITKISTLIPVGNGLDTIDPALQQDAGTLLVADNIIQERDGEWRRRNGFTNVSTDNVSSTGTIWSPANGSVAPFQVATNGAGGMVAADYKNLFFYSPATASWQPSTSGTFYTTAEDAYDVALARAAWSDRRLNAFATDGSLAIVSKDILAGASVAAGASGSIVDMASGAVLTEYFLFSVASAIAVRCAILGQYFCWFFVDSSGNLFAYVWNKATSNTGSFINLKTGCQTGATVALDAMYYTGTSITVVVKIAAGGFQFIEFTPSAGTKATDVLVGAPTPSTCLTLIPEPSGSGTRLVGISSAAPQTQVMRFSISGGLSSNDAIEAIQASNMTGCASNSGADFAVVYQNNATKALRRNTKIAGVVGTPTTIPQGVTSSIQPYIESHGWGIAGDDRWFFVMGQCQPSTTDPQNTYVVWCDSFQSSNLGAPSSAVLPLQGHGPVYTGDMGGVSQISKISTRKFAAGLAKLVHYQKLPSGQVSDYVTVGVIQTIPNSTDLGTLNQGQPAYRNGVPILPGRLPAQPTLATGFFYTNLMPIGLMSPPTQLVITPAGGGSLTALGTYQWCHVIEYENQYGDVWRSPPSVPVSVTLTGVNQQVTMVTAPWSTEVNAAYIRYKYYRTQNLGSTFTLCYEYVLSGAGDFNPSDSSSDASIIKGEILYTTGEQTNLCWPPVSHVWIFDDRLWGVNRDFRSEVQYSKNLQPGRQPETTAANALDLDDQWGDITGGSSVEGRCVIFKKNAIYFVQGDGLTDSGSGQNYTVTRISDDIGALPGSPLVNAGDAIFFVSQRGVYSVNNQGKIQYVGGGVDIYFRQAIQGVQETIYDGCWSPLWNQVRFVTTNYVLVYDRNFPDQNGVGTWSRWTGPMCPARRCLIVNNAMVLFKTDGTVWREDLTGTQTTDQGTSIPSSLRTAWVRVAKDGSSIPQRSQQPLRFRSGRALFTRDSGGAARTAQATVYFNDDDSQTQTFTSQSIAGATLTGAGEFFPTQQKCTSFSLGFTWPVAADLTFRLTGFSANIGIRAPNEQRRPNGEKWS